MSQKNPSQQDQGAPAPTPAAPGNAERPITAGQIGHEPAGEGLETPGQRATREAQPERPAERAKSQGGEHEEGDAPEGQVETPPDAGKGQDVGGGVSDAADEDAVPQPGGAASG
jgi:hypothetical protein